MHGWRTALLQEFCTSFMSIYDIRSLWKHLAFGTVETLLCAHMNFEIAHSLLRCTHSFKCVNMTLQCHKHARQLSAAFTRMLREH